MIYETAVSEHYTHGRLLEAIRSALEKQGKTPENLTVEDLAPVDEFHIGGRSATDHLLDQLEIPRTSHVLDVGCGLGGASRYIAKREGCRVTGIDLTDEYVEVGKELCAWTGLENQVNLRQGNAMDMPFAGSRFDGAVMLHVGMNIRDKQALIAEVGRVLRPGAFFGIYDIVQVQNGELTYPVPWATEESTSTLDHPDIYRSALKQVGFTEPNINCRRDFALDFFKTMAQRLKVGGQPPLGLHTLMRESSPVKIKNMIHNIEAGLVAPVEIIAQKN